MIPLYRTFLRFVPEHTTCGKRRGVWHVVMTYAACRDCGDHLEPVAVRNGMLAILCHVVPRQGSSINPLRTLKQFLQFERQAHG